MKNLIYLIFICICLSFTSCQMCTRRIGGTSEYTLEPGEKLVEITWKGNNLWFLTEPMDSDYIPKTKTFKESSNFGVLNGKVIVHERK